MINFNIMAYLYHRVPLDMRGDILYPLNQLKDIYPDIYGKENAKYVGREVVKSQRIPILNCLWNDVLHFTAVPPIEFKKVFAALGKEYTYQYYQVEPESLPKECCVIYLYQQKNREDKFTAKNFVKYDPALLDKLSVLPDETVAYYKKCIDSGEKMLIYHRVPHILYKGSLDVRDSSIQKLNLTQ